MKPNIPGLALIAMAFAVAMCILACEDRYKRVGNEAADPIYPQGVSRDFSLTYTETRQDLSSEDSSDTRVIAVLRSPLSEDFTNLEFQYRTFPDGLRVEYFDDQGRLSTIEADYAIIYAQTNIYDLQGHVVLETHDGKRLVADQLFWDRNNDWIFTEGRFTLTNPEEGTLLNGTGMDFNRDFTYFNAHQTGGQMEVPEEEEDPS
ncbi:LPS export ABC transporter periplasmic protein LptC [Robiginitalea sp. SC105]|uniref:LPS export ABC transporter periplasmic protein LptC n=1 Tax=Robiginitalea sp. SC105 TaxID=2762332 RepID=UPI0016399F18|nr:LPS export ABC transporter periplasmic protein LptC [Robiginitalea sp. SC105]MBC2837805.1 LPS export ABC transporter periplasmic protein LptC [Robiginitalea sp. SC105]